MQRTITIVGGGIAGLTLGIGLRQQQVPVILHEAGHYPRHRVCGEFISGKGLHVLRELGLWERFLDQGARPALSTAFFAGRKCLLRTRLPEPAFCLSRFKLDRLLARLFQEQGGQLLEGSSWKEEAAEGVVLARGRTLQAKVDGWRYYGLKMHAQSVALENDLEMHLTHQGYVGLCAVEDDSTNICGLFRRASPSQGPVEAGRAQLLGLPGSVLATKVDHAQWREESFCSVAGLSLRPERARNSQALRIGDALTMIAPVTGNGMSMAFESARAAIEPITAYSRRISDWQTAQSAVAQECDRRFTCRLRWASWLQTMLFQATPRPGMLGWLIKLPGVWRVLFSVTR